MARGLAACKAAMVLADRSQMVSQVRCLAHAPETGEALSLLRIRGVIRPLALPARVTLYHGGYSGGFHPGRLARRNLPLGADNQFLRVSSSGL